jgi:hypothetical protein
VLYEQINFVISICMSLINSNVARHVREIKYNCYVRTTHIDRRSKIEYFPYTSNAAPGSLPFSRRITDELLDRGKKVQNQFIYFMGIPHRWIPIFRCVTSKFQHRHHHRQPVYQKEKSKDQTIICKKKNKNAVLKSIYDFFLENAGELRFISLRRRRDKNP